MAKHRKKLTAFLVSVLLLLVLAAIIFFSQRDRPQILGEVDLDDGRILRIESITYGTTHKVGVESPLLRRLHPWLPQALRDFLTPKIPRSTIDLDKPGLVVFFNAVDRLTGTNVDCQAVRLEFVDRHGNLYGSENSYWSGFQGFSRQGNAFHAYPRDEKILTLRYTSWRDQKKSDEVQLPNPHLVQPTELNGQPLPQSQKFDSYQITISSLEATTNGSPENYWETPATYWKPEILISKDGQADPAWEIDWIAADPLGNEGKFLGLKPNLKFAVTAHPHATNTAAETLLKLPSISLDSTNITRWDLPAKFGVTNLTVLGFFPPGVQVFSEGTLLTNSPVIMTAVRGGAPSGWTSSTKPVTPLKSQTYYGHYSDAPVIYVHAPELIKPEHLGLRLRDENDRCWIAERESQGTENGFTPFILRAKGATGALTPELVRLTELKAEFLVQTSPK